MGIERNRSAAVLLIIGLAMTAAAVEDEGLDLSEADVVYRLKEQVTTVGEDGLKQTRIKHEIEILQPDALDYIGDVEIPYNGHYQRARLVRAETVTPGGERLPVQEELVHDQLPESQAAYAEYSDSRQLVFSMPGLTVGAVMEYEVELTDTEPVIPGEYWDDFTLDEFAPVRESRYELHTPADRPLRVHLIGELTHTASTNDGVRIDTWSQRDLPAVLFEAGMPPLAEVRPSVQVTTVPSWQVVDAWYRDLIHERDSTSPEIEALAAELTEGLTNEIDRINALSYYAQQSIRYVAIELGQGAYQPRPATDCLRHLYGDCKDQSILLISLLRAIGIDAEIALIRPRSMGEVLLDQPSPSQFNHAIAYVPRDTGDLWLDPTVPFIDAESFSANLDDVQALVIPQAPPTHDPDDASAWFIPIAPLPVDHCRSLTLYEVDLSPDGLHHVRKSVTGYGRNAALPRFQLFSQTKKELEEAFKEYAEGEPGFDRLLDWQFDPLDRLTPSFTHTITYRSEGIMEPSATGFTTLFTAANLENLLEVEWWDSGEDDRTHDWVSRSHSADAIEFRVNLPPAYVLANPAKSYRGEVPQGRIAIETELEDRIAITRISVESQPARIAAAKHAATKRKTDRTIQRAMRTVEYADQAEVLLQEFKPHAARKLLREALAEQPDDPYLHYRLGQNLLSCGYLVAARAAYEEAIHLKPEVMSFYVALAETYSGTVGFQGKGYRRDQVLAVFDRALPHVEPATNVELQRALALATNDDGDELRRGSEVDESIAILDRLLEEDDENIEALILRGHCRAFLDQYDDAVDDFSQALELDPDHFEAYYFRWRYEALAGNVESAIQHLLALQDNAANQYQMLTALAVLLVDAGELDDALYVAEVAAALPGISTQARNGVVEFKQLNETNLRDYTKFRDLSSPESAFLTLMTGIFYDNPDTIRAALSQHVDLPCQMLRQFPLGIIIGALDDEFLNMSLATLMAEDNVTRTDLPSGDVYLSIERSTGGSAAGFKLTALLTREEDAWKVADFNQTVGPCRIVAGLMDHYIGTQDFKPAWPLMEYLQEFYQEESGDDPIVRLLNTPFSNRTNQVLAITAAGLLTYRQPARRESAVAYLERALADEPDNAYAQNLLGMAHLQARRFERASTSFSHAARIDPNNEQYATMNLAALMVGGDLARAGSALQQLQATFPASAELPGMQLTYHLKSGEVEKAAQLDQQVRRGRSRFDPSSHSIQLYIATEDIDALERIEKDLAKNPGQTGVRLALAEAYSALHRLDDTARQLEALLLSDPFDLLGRSKLAEVLILKGRPDEARAIIHQLSELADCPDTVPVSYLLHALGDFDAAAEKYVAEAADENDAESAIFMHLFAGISTTEAGNREAGREHFEAALADSAPDAYPAIFAAHLLDRVSFEDVSGVVDACEDQLRRAEMRCEAAYYGALKARFDGQPDRALALFQQAADTRASDMIEFFLSHAELAHAARTAPLPL